MRTALIAALERTEDGSLRATLPVAGRSVLARQVDLLRALGCERIVCLCDRAEGEVLKVQQSVEAAGGSFQVLRGFLHLPALVRAEDELVVLGDGVLPDPGVVARMLGDGAALGRLVACFPEHTPLVERRPADFERIDAARHWAGLLVMRGAPVQQLADFPPDADAISLLLRLALQAGTPCRDVPEAHRGPAGWLVASDAAALAAEEQALIARAAGRSDWRVPSQALAALAVRSLAERGILEGPLKAALAGAAALAGGAVLAAWNGAAGLALAAAGAFVAVLAGQMGAMRAQLQGGESRAEGMARFDLLVDGLAAAALLLALSQPRLIAPLAALGPVMVGLARLARRDAAVGLLTVLADRTVLLGGLALAAGMGVLHWASALAALGLLTGLLRLSRPPLS